MRRLFRAIVRRLRRARYRLTVDPPAWADNPTVHDLTPLDPTISKDLESFRG